MNSSRLRLTYIQNTTFKSTKRNSTNYICKGDYSIRKQYAEKRIKRLVSMCIQMYKRQTMYRMRGVMGIRGGEGYSDKLLTILYNVHSFLCLLWAAKDGILKNSSMS